MSIEAVTPTSNNTSSNGNTPATTKVEVARFTPGGASSATPSDFRELGDVLLGEEMSMMGGEGASWTTASAQRSAAPPLSRSTSSFLPPTHPPTPSHHQPQQLPPQQPQQQQQQQQFFACPPAQLTRHASLPVTMMRQQHPMPVPMHHQFVIPTHHMPVMAMPPPSLNRQRSHGYVMHPTPYGMQPRLVAFHPMPMHPHQMPVHHPAMNMNRINLSVSHQQTPTNSANNGPAKTDDANSNNSKHADSVEPIAFHNASDARMSLGEIDSIALAMFSEPPKSKDGKRSRDAKHEDNNNEEEEDDEVKDEGKDDDDGMMFKASTASSIGCGQDLEKALDSLDKFLPEADFRPSDLADFRASDLADMAPPMRPSISSMLVTPRNNGGSHQPGMHPGRPLIMSPHMKTISSPAEAMQMMLHVGTPMHHHMHHHLTPRSSPKPMATCKVGGCDRRVRSKGFCKTHGGGRKCNIEGCKKSSQNGEFCIGHGGGKKCKQEGCAKAAQSHGLCKAHGGGARCKYPNCNKSSQGGGLCRAHGGGKRCQASGCPKGAQRGNFCATHGGFRNCHIEGCVRTDRGGGFCEVHRRGRLCKIDGCKKLSRNQGMCTMHIREDKQDEELMAGGVVAAQ